MHNTKHKHKHNTQHTTHKQLVHNTKHFESSEECHTRVVGCYQSPVNKLINGEYDDHHCDHAVAEVNIYDDDDAVDDVDQIRGGGKQVD